MKKKWEKRAVERIWRVNEARREREILWRWPNYRKLFALPRFPLTHFVFRSPFMPLRFPFVSTSPSSIFTLKCQFEVISLLSWMEAICQLTLSIVPESSPRDEEKNRKHTRSEGESMENEKYIVNFCWGRILHKLRVIVWETSSHSNFFFV